MVTLQDASSSHSCAAAVVAADSDARVDECLEELILEISGAEPPEMPPPVRAAVAPELESEWTDEWKAEIDPFAVPNFWDEFGVAEAAEELHASQPKLDLKAEVSATERKFFLHKLADSGRCVHFKTVVTAASQGEYGRRLV